MCLITKTNLAAYIGECQRLGIKVLPPSVNESDLGFTVSGNNIRYGLLAIKNLGRAFIDQIIKEAQIKALYKPLRFLLKDFAAKI